MEPITATSPLIVTDASSRQFDALYRAHRDRVYAWALRYGGGQRAWAEDVTHDVFVQLHRHLRRLDPEDLGAWLYRVTANVALGRLRRETGWTRALTHWFLPTPPPTQPDEWLELDEEARAALHALQALPARERLVVTMHVLDGRSQRDIARALSLSEGYVSKLLTRAWDQLRARGWEVADAP